jgi:hypothetical protein
MKPAIASISGSRMPRVVTAGVPTRTTGREGRVLIERDRVLVDGNGRAAERGFGDFAGNSARKHVHQHQVVVGAAAHESKTGL